MANPFEFYFDFSSPYGYLASTQIDDLAASFGRRVEWNPILLGPIFKKSGAQALTAIPMKGEYALRDFARSARLHGIEYAHPGRFPIATVAAARGVLWTEHNVGAEQAKELARRIYRAYFVFGQNIDDPELIFALARKMGLDANRLARGIADEEIKNALRTRVQAALEKGVFGSPFVIVDGEPFWGFDRFNHIRKWLESQPES